MELSVRVLGKRGQEETSWGEKKAARETKMPFNTIHHPSAFSACSHHDPIDCIDKLAGRSELYFGAFPLFRFVEPQATFLSFIKYFAWIYPGFLAVYLD